MENLRLTDYFIHEVFILLSINKDIFEVFNFENQSIYISGKNSDNLYGNWPLWFE